MNAIKTKSLENIEQKMENMDEHSLRYQILQNAKSFKSSWIELGRALYTVSKDKLYREWGYSSFEIYTAKEIGIRKQTAMKLLRSYYFLEKEEPAYLKKDYLEQANASGIPSYETVDVLRLAKNRKTLDEDDYTALKKEIFEKGKDARQIKKDLTSMIRQREELEPEGCREKRKTAIVRRFLSVLKSLRQELEISKLVSAALIKDAASLISKLEEELG